MRIWYDPGSSSAMQSSWWTHPENKMTGPSPYRQPPRGAIAAIAIPAGRDHAERTAREAGPNTPSQPQ